MIINIQSNFLKNFIYNFNVFSMFLFLFFFKVKTFGEHAEEERRAYESSLDGFTQELTVTKHALRESARKEKKV